jgi:hypothetical protein
MCKELQRLTGSAGLAWPIGTTCLAGARLRPQRPPGRWAQRPAEAPAFAKRVQRGDQLECSHAGDGRKKIVGDEFGDTVDEWFARAHAVNRSKEFKFGCHKSVFIFLFLVFVEVMRDA